jgi:hypothetical protein
VSKTVIVQHPNPHARGFSVSAIVTLDAEDTRAGRARYLVTDGSGELLGRVTRGFDGRWRYDSTEPGRRDHTRHGRDTRNEALWDLLELGR